jgi:hypothetical protein
VSKAWRTLQGNHREVSRLYSDLHGPVFARRDWKAPVYARRSLGEDVEVESWYLAEHFLLAWGDWAGLRERYLRYFGQPSEKIPRSWDKLEFRCRTLAGQLLRDEALDEFISKSWSGTLARSARNDRQGPSSRSLFHNLVDGHRRWMLFNIAETLEGAPREEIRRSVDHALTSSHALETAHELNYQIKEEWEDASAELREDALVHIRNYQHATLTLSWLLGEEASLDDGDMGDSDSALIHAVSGEKAVIPSIEQFVTQLTVEPQEKQLLGRVLRRVQAAIADVGYNNFVEDVASSEFLGGPDSSVGGDGINLIPSHARGDCHAILLAVSRGDSRALGLPNIMKQVREHLIRCMNKTRAVVILCDYWRPDMLDDHLGDLRAHHDRGVRFLFLMVGTPERALSPVAVELGRAR